ncbi:Retrovirus-related Pol polyprotein from transposon TNT 1-94 [Vitis vinifera]|uniref:Retrovirus-related Pol polyprotein from transposon TNT 1-94 n=1 Tax=Vitis vinifera TaxID=29760 RepID=A0A438JXC6_VITVI|nr:Retrovirus-related Pol polyprotein from transposon TNT 1-94 [Vitis vinifera]
MAIVAHFDLELHQMDVKTTFLNGDLDEDVYMEQPTGFVEVGKEDLVCNLNKSIYGLKQHMLSTHFDMKDLGEASYILAIKILRDRANGVFKLSQRAYIEKILKRFNMHNCSSTGALIMNGDKFSKARYHQNDDEREEMRVIPYSSLVGSLMYAQVCTCPNIAFVVGMLGRYLSNLGSQHWKAAKKVLRCIDDKKSTTGHIFMMAEGTVSWKSVKQTLTASSTMEAEYVACYELLLSLRTLGVFLAPSN